MRGLAGVIALALSACSLGGGPGASMASATDPFPADRYAAVQDGHVFRLLPAQSSLLVLVHRAGALAGQGHDHVIRAADFRGAVHLAERKLQDSRFDLVVPVHRLQVDPPDAVERLGFSEGKPLSETARSGTRRNLLGPEVLDAAGHPFVHVRSEALVGRLPLLAMRIAITVRGTTARQWVPVEVEVDGTRMEARGRLVLHHEDLGLQPFSVLGGLLRVADPLVVLFHLVAEAEPASPS